MLHLLTRNRFIAGWENERSRVRGLGQLDAAVALDSAKKSAMRTLWLASPGPADAPPPDSACGPAVAGSEGLPCPAPGGCGSLLFGPSDPLTTGVTCGVLAGFARGRESALCPRPSVTKAARRCAGLGPARPLPRPPPVTPASPSPPASPPTFPLSPISLGTRVGPWSGNQEIEVSRRVPS